MSKKTLVAILESTTHNKWFGPIGIGNNALQLLLGKSTRNLRFYTMLIAIHYSVSAIFLRRPRVE